MTVEFDATIDDFVDVTLRSLAGSTVLRTWNWQAALTTAVLAGLMAYSLVSASAAVRLAIATGCAVLAAVLHLWTSRESFSRRVHKLAQEQLGTDGPIRITAELSETGVRMSQLGTHTLFEWSTIERIEESDDAVYFLKRDRSCFAVRKRGFDSAESKDLFIELAKKQIHSAQSRHP